MAVNTTEQVRWWENASDLHTHIEEWLAVEVPMLSYDMESQVYRYTHTTGRELVVPLEVFEVAMEEYARAHHCNYQRATWEMLHVWRWQEVDGELRPNLGRTRHG